MESRDETRIFREPQKPGQPKKLQIKKSLMVSPLLSQKKIQKYPVTSTLEVSSDLVLSLGHVLIKFLKKCLFFVHVVRVFKV